MTPSEVQDIAERFLLEGWGNPRQHKIIWFPPQRSIKTDRSGAYWEIWYRIESQDKNSDNSDVCYRPIIVDEDNGKVFFR